MNNHIPQLDIKTLSETMGAPEQTNNDFMIFEGKVPPPRWYTPFRQDYYPFLCLESGLIRNIVDLQPYQIRKNDLFFLKPSQILQIESISPDTTGKIIAFQQSFLDGEHSHLLEKLGFLAPFSSPIIPLTDDEAEEIMEWISDIKRKVEEEGRPHRRQIAINLISAFLLEIDSIYKLRSLPDERPHTRKTIINGQFHSLLSIHFLSERTVAFYASVLSITPKYLSELTKELTGKTAGELIDDRVILEAKVLLKNPDLSIKQIAEMLSFSDQFFFSKYFKNFTGSSPTEYRNQE